MNRKLSTASILAALAAGAVVTVAAGGSAAVATGYAKDSITSRHIKDGGVRGPDIANSSVTGAKVADDSLTGADIDEDSLGTVEVARAAGWSDTAIEAGTAEIARHLMGMTRAHVRADGSLVDSEGGAIIGSQQTDTPGRYLVELDGPHLGCLVHVSVTHNGAEAVSGSASAWRKGPIPETLGRHIVVETQAAGTDAQPDPLPFGMLIVC